jgi:hypothetical protein
MRSKEKGGVTDSTLAASHDVTDSTSIPMGEDGASDIHRRYRLIEAHPASAPVSFECA